MSNAPLRLAGHLVLGWALLAPTLAQAIDLGDIIVADRTSGLVFIDPATGAQHILSGAVSGHGFGDVTTNASGDVYAIHAAAGVVYRIDTITGARTVVTSGGNLLFPRSIDLAPDGNLYVLEGGPSGAVVRVEPGSGTQAVVTTGIINAFAVDANGVGYIALDDAASAPNYHLYRLDLTNGQTTRISNTGFYDPRGLAADAAGNLILTEYYQANLQRIDTATGAVTPLSSSDPLMAPWGVTVESNGKIIVADNQNLMACHPPPPGPTTCPGAVYRVASSGGAPALVTEKGRLTDVTGIDIYRGPNVVTAVRGVSWGRIKSLYR